MCWKILINARLTWNYTPGPYSLFKKANIAYASLWTVFYLIHTTLRISKGRVESIQKTLPRDAPPLSSQPHLPGGCRVGVWSRPYGTAHMGLFGRYLCWCECHASSPSLATFQTERLQKQMFFPATPTVWFNLAFINSGVCFSNNVKTLGSGGGIYRHHIVTVFCSSCSK